MVIVATFVSIHNFMIVGWTYSFRLKEWENVTQGLTF